MENISTIILRAFDLKCVSAVKHKAGFICKTDNGRVGVLRAPQEAERIWFRYHVKEHLHSRGLARVGRLLLSAEGVPYAAYDGERFVVTPQWNGREASFAEASEWRQAVQTVARMHRLCRDMDASRLNGTAPRQADGDLAARGRTDAEALAGYRRRLLKRGKYSEFDMLFLRTFDEQMEALAQWQAAVAAAALETKLVEGQTVCHNLLKEENLLIAADGAMTVRNFAECAVGHFAFDLAALIKRYMKALPSDPVPLDEVLELYDCENPLRGEAIPLLRAALVFPDKYIKLCAQYYACNRTWTPGAFLSRMEELTRGLEAGRAYVAASAVLGR